MHLSVRWQPADCRRAVLSWTFIMHQQNKLKIFDDVVGAWVAGCIDCVAFWGGVAAAFLARRLWAGWWRQPGVALIGSAAGGGLCAGGWGCCQ